MTRILKLIPSSFAALFFSLPVIAQDNPSYEATISFISSKLKIGVEFREIDRCKFSFKSSILSNEWRFSAVDLDPSRVEVYDNSHIDAYSKEDKKIVRSINTNSVEPDRFLSAFPINGDISVVAPTKNNIPRIASALKHLIKICGGTKELF